MSTFYKKLPSKPRNLIFGSRPVMETILAGQTIEKIFIQKGHKLLRSKEFSTLIKEREIPYSYVPVEKLNKLSNQHHQGVIALLSPIDFTPLEVMIPTIFEQGRVPLVVVLDGVTDVHNFGAISRTARCMGVDALVIPTHSSSSLSGAAMKTSAGALASLPICRVADISVALKYLQNSGLMVVACYEKATQVLYDINLTLPTALIFGSEGEGIDAASLKWVTHHSKIPMQGPIASLNVSVAAGIMLYEAFRQRIL